MRRTLIGLAIVAGLVAACGSSAATGGAPAGGAPTGGTQPAATVAAATGSPAASVAAGTSVAGGAPMTPVACSLLTTAEAATALGVSTNPGAPSVDPKENVCTFGGTAIADMLKFVEISVTDPAEFLPGRAPVAGVFDRLPASGVGDAAYYQKDYLPNNSGTTMELSFSKGGKTFAVDVVIPGSPDAQLQASEKALALAAIGRM